MKQNYMLRKRWYEMPLRKKFYMIVGSVGLLILSAVLLNMGMVRYVLDNTKNIMDDNLLCYELQERLFEAEEGFSRHLSERSLESEAAYKQAVENVENCLDRLPYDYDEIGETRYSLTWSIRSCYGEYVNQQRRVISMESYDRDYAKALYKAYDMKKFLDIYLAKLTNEVLVDGNSYYENNLFTLSKLPWIFAVVGAVFLLVLFLIVKRIAGKIVKVLVSLSNVSQEMETNNFSTPPIEWEGKDEIGHLVSAFNKMKSATEKYLVSLEDKRQMEEALYKKELERAELEQKFSLAQLQLIKSQLNPHFLFNTLNMITRTAEVEEAETTEEMLVALSNLLRYGLRTTNTFAPLEQELKVVEDYMYIQKMRFGDRISWKIDCPRELYQEEIPVFLFQPLAENAMIHGISQKEEGGFIGVRIWREKGFLCCEVRDTGIGMTPERLSQVRDEAASRGKGIGIGLGNIYRRISAYYEEGGIRIESEEGVGTRIRMEFGKKKV